MSLFIICITYDACACIFMTSPFGVAVGPMSIHMYKVYIQTALKACPIRNTAFARSGKVLPVEVEIKCVSKLETRAAMLDWNFQTAFHILLHGFQREISTIKHSTRNIDNQTFNEKYRQSNIQREISTIKYSTRHIDNQTFNETYRQLNIQRDISTIKHSTRHIDN